MSPTVLLGSILAMLLAGAALGADSPDARKLFAIAPSLRPWHATRSVGATETTRESKKADDPEERSGFSAESSNAPAESPLEADLQGYTAMNGGPVLTHPIVVESRGGVAGFLQRNVFEPITNPETVKLRHATLTGGVVGAIKKGNPFYLLNPLVFAVDW